MRTNYNNFLSNRMDRIRRIQNKIVYHFKYKAFILLIQSILSLFGFEVFLLDSNLCLRVLSD